MVCVRILIRVAPKRFKLAHPLPKLDSKLLQCEACDALLDVRDCQEHMLGCNVRMAFRLRMFMRPRENVERAIGEVWERAPTQFDAGASLPNCRRVRRSCRYPQIGIGIAEFRWSGLKSQSGGAAHCTSETLVLRHPLPTG